MVCDGNESGHCWRPLGYLEDLQEDERYRDAHHHSFEQVIKPLVLKTFVFQKSYGPLDCRANATW